MHGVRFRRRRARHVGRRVLSVAIDQTSLQLAGVSSFPSGMVQLRYAIPHTAGPSVAEVAERLRASLDP